MVTISHAQAQVYLNQSLDGLLNSGDWILLQQHLSACPECRASRAAAGQLEDRLKRSFHRCWDGQAQLEAGLAAGVIQIHQARLRRQDRLLGALACLALIAVMVLLLDLGTSRSLQTQARVIPATAVPPTATPAATRLPPRFPEMVAYVEPVNGSPDIFLLNPGDEPLNLTRHLAHDTNPSWSPDGNWLAFLSDRSGKFELYRMALVDLRLEQLTDEPEIEWQGPPSWSGDGTRITLAGSAPGAGGVYIVDGGPPENRGRLTLVEGTEGAGAPRFSADGSRIVFLQEGQTQRAGIVVLTAARLQWMTLPRLVQIGETVDWTALEWSGKIPGIVYAYGEPARTPVDEGCRQELVLYASPYQAQHPGDESEGGFQLSHELPAIPPELVMIYTSRENRIGCTNPFDCGLQALSIDLRMYPLPGLCVTGGPEPGSWSSGRGWLVFPARREGETQEGLYAVRTPWGDAQENRRFPVWTVLELARFDGPAPLAQVRPRALIHDSD